LKFIRRRTVIFAAFSGLGIAISALLLSFGVVTHGVQVQILLVIVLLASTISASLWVREYKKLKTAHLIIENSILHIRTAVISNVSGETAKPQEAENTEAFVSYFGILLDSKIIKFNQDGIYIKAAEIGKDYISLTYGTDKRVQNTRLLRAAVDPAELDGIVKKFHFETGVNPVINI